jgi:hypothetical protein
MKMGDGGDYSIPASKNSAVISQAGGHKGGNSQSIPFALFWREE